MALQTSGAISLNDIHVEAGGTTGTTASVSDSDIRSLISLSADTEADFSDWYGAANEVDLTSAGLVNGQQQQKEITASSFISAGGTLIIPSDIWVWSDATGTPALTIDISCTIKNNGKIIGKGGIGGSSAGNGGGGGEAIKINSGVTGVTVINNSGGYIAGGGGGGGGSAYYGGGGGAGGGKGGSPSVPSGDRGGAGGTLNANGSAGADYNGGAGIAAGGAGGTDTRAGGRINSVSVANDGSIRYGAGAGGGSRRLSTTNTQGADGDGGSWGQAGTRSSYWNQGYGGAAGKAINDSGVTYTLTNNGTIYGGT